MHVVQQLEGGSVSGDRFVACAVEGLGVAVIADAFDSLGLEPSPEVALARSIAVELDRQAGSGDGINAALVRQYRETLEALTGDDDDGPDPIESVLAKIFDEAPAGAADKAGEG